MKTRRLFFALWPDSTVRQAIVETFSQLPQPPAGRKMQLHNLHITLHFVGPVSAEVKDCMHQAAQTVSTSAFALTLDCYGIFPRAKIYWMGCQQTPQELLQLNKSLGEAIEKCGYQPQKRDYSPHLTLMRKCVKPHDDAIQEKFAINWRINEFVLVESCIDKHGVNYQVIEKYPLS